MRWTNAISATVSSKLESVPAREVLTALTPLSLTIAINSGGNGSLSEIGGARLASNTIAFS